MYDAESLPGDVDGGRRHRQPFVDEPRRVGGQRAEHVVDEPVGSEQPQPDADQRDARRHVGQEEGGPEESPERDAPRSRPSPATIARITVSGTLMTRKTATL